MVTMQQVRYRTQRLPLVHTISNHAFSGAPAVLTQQRPATAVADSSNNVRDEDRAVHEWYRFVLSFPPHIVREYLDRFDVGDGTVLDPFCGTGTTLVEAKKLGIPAFGCEPSPMAHFASSIKTDWSPSTRSLRQRSAQIADQVIERLASEGIEDAPGQSSPNCELATLPHAAHKLLLANSISPLPLHKTLALLGEIQHAPASVRGHLLLGVARILPMTVGNLKFGPEVGLGRIKPDAAVISEWLKVVASMADDLDGLTDLGEVRPLRVDARSAAQHLPAKGVDLVFTSPPYPNEKDYTRTTRLESVLLGFYSNMAELRAFKKALLRSNTRNIYVTDNDHLAITDYAPVVHLADEIEQRRMDLGKTSGFERNYHKVVLQYFGGMTRHLEDLRGVLRPGAHLAYVVGDQASFFRIMIRTGHLLADIAERLGYEVEGIDLFRTRIATATGEQLREEVVVLRWPG
jgi:SAM-dependent methyltransferase